ncbi:MAG: GNAT family N-acetyltransferase [Chloroflexi bacterium]|nr:GNAT family N-acetyltransferase [Chloroflexota bacterium]
MLQNLPAEITLRPINDADLGFLCDLYASTREYEMRFVPWSDVEKTAFLESQFNAQHQYYHQQYPDAEFSLILQDGQPIGRIYIQRREDEYRLMDIALMPASRNQGLGSQFIRNLLAKATAEGVAVRLHVENYNPAYQLYVRLGFQVVAQNGVYTLMEWLPQ